MSIKALNKVKVLIDGEAVDLIPGKEYHDLDQDTEEALLRGGDAVKAKAPVEPEPAPEQAAEEEKPKPKKRRTRSKKDAGPAPENKDAGPAPEDK